MTRSRAERVWSDDEITKMRRYLAQQWHQSITQVTDWEARYYLNEQARSDAMAALARQPKRGRK